MPGYNGGLILDDEGELMLDDLSGRSKRVLMLAVKGRLMLEDTHC